MAGGPAPIHPGAHIVIENAQTQFLVSIVEITVANLGNYADGHGIY